MLLGMHRGCAGLVRLDYLGSKSWQHDSYTELVRVRKTRLPNPKGSVGILLR